MRESGTKLKNGYWRVRITVKDEFGRPKQKGFERKTLLEAQRAAMIYEQEHGRIVETVPRVGTMADLFRETDECVWKTSGPQHRRSMNLYRTKWEGVIGETPVDEITAPILTRAMKSIVMGQSKSAIDKCALSVKQALAYAVSDLGWITSNPANDIRKPKPTECKIVYAPPTREEYERMLELAEPRHELLIRLIGGYGMRPIEAGRVRRWHLFSVQDHWLVRIPKSKTDAGVRAIPISDEVMRMIEARTDADWAGIKDPINNLEKWWRENSNTRLYDFRGWRADEWRRAGINPQIRTHLLGHTEEKFTQEVYETITAPDVLAAFVNIS